MHNERSHVDLPEATEAQILQAVLDYLTVRRVLAFRMNVGGMVVEHGGRRRIVKFGVAGMADILSFPHGAVLWIECKTRTGHQSALQKSFQAQVEGAGHRYILARGLDDLEKALDDEASIPLTR